jgi:hypothetical protein
VSNRTKRQHRRAAGQIDGSAIAGAVVLFNAGVTSTLALYHSTGSDLVTLAGLAITTCLAAWYLWMQRQRS